MHVPNSFPPSGTKSFSSLFWFWGVFFCTQIQCLERVLHSQMPMYSAAPSGSFVCSYSFPQLFKLNYGIDIPCVECHLALPFSLTVDSQVYLGVFVVLPINVPGSLLHLCKPFVCWRWRHAMPPDIECEYERKGEEMGKRWRRELTERAVFQSCASA